MLSMANPAMAQASGSESSNYLIYVLLAVAVLVFFGLIVQVSDNLMAIEAKQMGAAQTTQANFSIFPNWQEIFPSKSLNYTADRPVHRLRRGFDIALEGAPEAVVEDAPPVRTYALQPPNFTGIMPIPKMLVEVGEEVKAGDPLFFDKRTPEVKFCAPVSGEVIEIKRGDKRAIVEVVILADKEIKYREFPILDLEQTSREDLVAHLVGSGFWPMIKQRPFNILAEHDEVPRDIFISTFDTAPLAPDLSLVVEGKQEAFQAGLDALGKLTDGKVYLGLDARSDTPPSPVFTEAKGVEFHFFRGPHPSGNVGVQIHHIAPISTRDKLWTLDVQAVITLGTLVREGRLDCSRVVAISGAELERPRYLRTHIGAKLSELLAGSLKGDNLRIISGDVLSGQEKDIDQYLNFQDDLITVVKEGDYYEMFGWLLPLKPRPSISRTFPNFLLPGMSFRADTNTHGEKRAFVVTDDYERVLPMDIYCQQLMKAILINDFEQMEGLGIHELVEEDVALCEFVCVSKQPLQQILRRGLDTIYEQS